MKRLAISTMVLLFGMQGVVEAKPITVKQAQAAVERYAASESTAAHGYAVDRCRIGVRRAKCRLREWGVSTELPWIEGPATDYEAEFVAVVRRVNRKLTVHLAGLCRDDDRSPACDY